MGCGIFNKIEKVFINLDGCLEALVENRKKDAVKKLFGVGKSLTELTIETTSCVIKHTPQAISTIREVKKDIISTIETEIKEAQKEEKQRLLEDKIKKLERFKK